MRENVWRIDAPGANADIGGVVWAPFKSLLNTAIYLIALFIALFIAPLYFTWDAFALFLLLSYVTLFFGHSLGVHRRLIHKSFECSKPFERFLLWLGVLVGMAGPFGILRIHEIRDWPQRQPSCHEFFSHRRGLWIDAFWQLHCTFKFDKPPKFTIEPEFKNDRWYQFMEATWPLHQLILALALYMIGGISFVVCGVAVRVAVSVTSHWLVTYFAHNPGPGRWLVKDAAVQTSNLEGWGFLAHGECWHNNHHAFPASAKMRLEPYQLDPGGQVLKFLARCHLVKNLGMPRELGHCNDLELNAPLDEISYQK